jgi:hypothetical protein
MDRVFGTASKTSSGTAHCALDLPHQPHRRVSQLQTKKSAHRKVLIRVGAKVLKERVQPHRWAQCAFEQLLLVRTGAPTGSLWAMAG